MVEDRSTDGDLLVEAGLSEARAERRLELLRRQLAMPAVEPASEWQASLTVRLASDAVAALTLRLRTALADQASALPLPIGFEEGVATSDGRLVACALARADEHRLQVGLRDAGGAEWPAGPLASLHGEAAALELALLHAESRRIDRLGDPLLPADDIDAETMHALVWRLCAAARGSMLASGVAAARADPALTAAAARLFADHDEGGGAGAASVRLAARLLSDGAPPAALCLDALAAARPGLAAAAIAGAARVPQASALAALMQPERFALLLRAVDADRAAAAAILLRLCAALLIPDERLIAIVESYERLDRDAVGDAVRALSLDPAYRAAIAEAAGA